MGVHILLYVSVSVHYFFFFITVCFLFVYTLGIHCCASSCLSWYYYVAVLECSGLWWNTALLSTKWTMDQCPVLKNMLLPFFTVSIHPYKANYPTGLHGDSLLNSHWPEWNASYHQQPKRGIIFAIDFKFGPHWHKCVKHSVQYANIKFVSAVRPEYFALLVCQASWWKKNTREPIT